jgi:probable HAF family extracellular repeat protein
MFRRFSMFLVFLCEAANVLPAAFLILACLVANSANAATSYRLVDLGVCTSTGDAAQDVADNGMVGLQQGTSAYIWNNGNLNPPSGVPDGNAQMRINNLGHIAGSNNLNAYIWRDGVTTPLGTLEGGYTFSSGINDSDQVVGVSYCSSINRYRGFLWQNGMMTDIGGFLSYGETRPTDINNAGQIVGSSSVTVTCPDQPFLLENNVMTALSMPSGYTRGTAERISNSGKITGTCYDSSLSKSRAVAWIGGQTYDLGSLAGQSCSSAYGINDLGQVVGSTGQNIVQPAAAFLWDSGQMLNVNNLVLNGKGYVVREALAINNAGEIVGTATYGNQTHAVLLTPVPEPGMFVLFGIGAVSLFGYGWRRRKRGA